MTDPYNHKRRIASAAVAYLHACGCAGRRDPDHEREVLHAFVDAMVPRGPNPQTEGDTDAR